MESKISVVVGTDSEKEPVDRLDSDGCEDSEKFIISEGEGKLKPELSWQEYSFVKVLIDRRNGEDVRMENLVIECEEF